MSGIIGGIKGVMKKKISGQAVGDANWSKVSLLLNGDGINGSTSIVDSSGSPKTITSAATIDTSTYKFGTGAIRIGPTGAKFAAITNTSDLDLSGDFTIECWAYMVTSQSWGCIFSNGLSGSPSSYGQVVLAVESTNIKCYLNAQASSLSANVVMPSNTWTHLAVTMSGTTLTIWVNGVNSGSTIYTGARGAPYTYSTLGRWYYGNDNYYFDGYIDDFRVTKGLARYTANFTPPTTALPSATVSAGASGYYSDPYWSKVGLMLTGDDLLDKSANVKTITATGTVASTTSVKKYGTGSLSFDGSTGYLTSSASNDYVFGTDNFTIECWLNTTDTKSYSGIINDNSYHTTTSNFLIMLNYVAGKVTFWMTNNVLCTTATSVNTGNWVHLAVVRDSPTSVKIYVNGVSDTSATISSSLTFGAGSGLLIGNQNGFTRTLAGYMDDIRITKGVARYTSNFTPPTYSLAISAAISSITPVGSYHPNWGDGYVTTSNNIGLSSSATLTNGKYTVTDTYGVTWNILANFGYNYAKVAPTRWNGVMWRDVSNRDHVYDMSSKQLANSSLSTTITPGVLYCDAVSFSNASGPGFSNWYSDSKSTQAFPALNTSITTALTNSGTRYDTTSSADNTGGAVYFEPPVGTTEVMIDFANSHSNGPCSIAVVDKTTGNIVKTVIGYGQFGTVNTATSALNDANSRTVIFRHQTNYVYFNTDHAGTIAGSHYILYR
jgi:hypothetical protein